MVGIDLVKIDRFKNIDEYFIKRVYTDKEIEIYNSLNENDKILFLAGRWACKEAIYKATKDKTYLHYSILKNEDGSPYVDEHNDIEISISHDGDYVIAIALKKNLSEV